MRSSDEAELPTPPAAVHPRCCRLPPLHRAADGAACSDAVGSSLGPHCILPALTVLWALIAGPSFPPAPSLSAAPSLTAGPTLHPPASHCRYPTFATLAGADPSDDAHIGGGVHPIDGVDVWPMLTRRNDTQPRPCTVVTEVSAIEVEQQVEQPPQYPQDSSHKQQVEPRPQYPQDGSHVDDDDQGSDRTIPDQKRSGRTTPALLWKLVTLAGQSNYYDETGGQVNGTGLPCLLSRQPDPPQPGRTDPIVNGPASHERHACPVCNETLPCLFELVSDPQERHNRAAEPAMAGLVERLRRAIDAANANSYVNGSLDAALLSSRYEPINTTQQWGGFLGPCYRRKG
jgi:hypothetical protein